MTAFTSGQILRVKDLIVGFGERTILDHVSLDVAAEKS